MSMDSARLRGTIPVALTLLIPTLAASPVRAGNHKVRTFVPVYAQQAPAPVVYSAPATYAVQAPMMYAAPASYAAPAATMYSAPAATMYSAPAATQVVNAPAAVGNAPATVAGSRLKAVDRGDIIEELRKEYKEEGADGATRRERRKALRESAKTKFAESLDVDAESLNESELQDIENIVGSIMDGDSSSQAGKGVVPWTGTPYAGTVPAAACAPAVLPAALAPVQAVRFVQPVVPVQLLVPVPPKHRLFHH